jgi:DeoR family transcriptional regulator, fructose operon transcriptional repressor
LIARAAKSIVRDGETVLIDGGTTTFYLARELLGRRLQLVTNSLPIATLFQNDEHVETVLVGGLLYPRYGVTLGPGAEETLSAIHANTLFLSVAGLHGGDLFNQNMLLVQAERLMMRQSQRTVLLIDSMKFSQQALVKLADLKAVHTLITDAPPPPHILTMIEDAGVELIVAPAAV